MKYGTSTAPNLERAKSGMYEFKFGQYINEAFTVITNNVGLFIGFAALWAVIYFAAQIIPFIGPLVYSFVIGPCLAAGLYYAADKSYNKQDFEFGLFFKGFDKLGELALMTLLQSLLIAAACIPLIIAFIMGAVTMDSSEGLGVGLILLGIVFILPVIYLGVSWMFASLLVIFHDMEPWPAMETSRKIITANFFPFLGLAIVAGLIGIAGALALGIGLLFTIPAAMVMVYTAFRDIVGMPYQNEEIDMMSHLVD